MKRAELVNARKEVLRKTWHTTIGYLAAVRADRALKFSDFTRDSIRATIHPKPGQLGLSLLGTGAAHLTPWHGTGVIDGEGRVSVDFLVSAQHSGLVPLFADLLPANGALDMPQPLAMIPQSAIKHGELDPQYLRTIHLTG